METKAANATPKYFDYLPKHGKYLTRHFALSIERESLEADISFYRRRVEKQHWVAAVYLRKLLEQIADGYLNESQYEYGKMLGKKLHEGIDDGFIPAPVGYKMIKLNKLVRGGAHSGDYSQSELEKALVQLDVMLRDILKYEGKQVSGDEVEEGTDDVLIAHSDSIEEKARQAAQLTGNEKLVEESREANKRAIEAEHAALAARKREENAVRESEQLRLELEAALQTIDEQRAAINKRAVRMAAYGVPTWGSSSMESVYSKAIARKEAEVEELNRVREDSNARVAEAKEYRRAQEAALTEAADQVSDFEEHLDNILKERDFVSALLRGGGNATDEQRRIVNFPIDQSRKRRLLKVVGKAGTGKTLCLLAATMAYLEPHGQRSMPYGSSQKTRRALFVCFNKDLARYVRGLLEGFPGISEQVEVANYDQFLNQFIRASPIHEYKYLSEYARDVRLQRKPDMYGVERYWSLLVDKEEKRRIVRCAIEEVRNFYQSNGMQEYCNSPYLDAGDDFNVKWLIEEIEWLEGRYHSIEEGRSLYPGAERVGRGRSGRNPIKNKPERTHVMNVWVAFCRILESRNLYTLEQTVTTLLRSQYLPSYDIVAIDEAQDLNSMHIELFLRFRAKEGFILIAGDEGQRVYPRNFSWRQVDSTISSTTYSLSVNKRNPDEIRHFAERLEDGGSTISVARIRGNGAVQVRCQPREYTVAYIKELATRGDDTTVLITTDVGLWERLLREAGIVTKAGTNDVAKHAIIRMQDGGVCPGVYCFTQLRAKGLEFDNVIIDYDHEVDARDEGRERRIRYMQFTRARKSLLIRYEGEPPKLLAKYYPDYLAEQGQPVNWSAR